MSDERTTWAYVRLSVDTEQVGIDAQARLCRQYAKSHGWDLPDERIVRETARAYKRGQRAFRPKFEELVGQAELTPDSFRIVVWSLDRLLRDLEDFIRLRKLADNGAEILSTTGELDLVTDVGRTTSAILTSIKALEIETLTKRVQTQKDYQKSQGKFLGNGRRSFGYTDATAKRKINPKEQEALLEVYERLRHGESWNSLAELLNERGMRTPNGHVWNGRNLSKTFMSPVLRGILQYSDGSVAKAPWEPILTQEQVDDVSEIRGARRTFNGPPILQSPLSGLLICGRCSTRMRTQGSRKFSCSKCFNSIHRQSTELLIEKMTLIGLRDFQPRNLNSSPAPDVTEEESKLAEYAKLRAMGVVSEAMYATGIRELQRKIDQKNMQWRRSVRSIPEWMASEEAILSAWETMSPQQKRSVIMEVFDSVKIAPYQPLPGQPDQFDPYRIQIEYRRD